MDSTFLKGLRVLRYMVDQDGPSGVSALARALGLPKSNIHRVMKTLEAAGLVRADPRTRGYLPTMLLWDLGQKVYDRLDLAREAAPLLERIHADTGGLAVLAVRDGLSLRVLAVVGSDPAGTIRAEARLPLCEGALGCVLLAHADIPNAERALTDADLPPGGLASIRAEMAAAAVRGCALDRGELGSDWFGAAAPVRDIRGGVMAAVAALGPLAEFGLAPLAGLERAAVEAAGTLSETLSVGRAEPEPKSESEPGA